MLSHSEARSIAESMWGTGGTHCYKTNRRGAFYFACSGHGGFVIDAAAMTDAERNALRPYISSEAYTRYMFGSKTRIMHRHRSRGFKIPFDYTIESGEFYLFEEDCDWCLAYLLAGIKRENDGAETKAAAIGTFWRWFDRNNPEVIERERRAKLRADKDPDFIISALSVGNDKTRVTTADGLEYVVTGYNYNNPFLSACTIC